MNDYKDYIFTAAQRFLKYVKYDTQSDDKSETIPSTANQKVLLEELMKELKDMGIESQMDESGHIYAMIKSNTPKKIPTIGFLAHVDTSNAAPGANINPIIHKNYQGGNIVLPKDNVIIPFKDTRLKDMIGHDIITTDGSTLLGADDKAGIAAIMDAANYFKKNPQVKHGNIAIAFTIDEEIGKGIDSFDPKKFGADYAYTIDGDDGRGTLSDETFSADFITVKIYGIATHPGDAYKKMINSIRLGAEFMEKFPKDKLCPEATKDREGFIHLSSIKGTEECTEIEILLRDFDESKFKQYESIIKSYVEEIVQKYPGSEYKIESQQQYRNMKKVVDKNPQVMEYAFEAIKRTGLEPKVIPCRGGTDGSNLSFRGIPTPNIYAAENSIHSRKEFLSVQELETTTKTIIELVKVWEEKS
ncbi:MAG TPA: peptidase T [Alphaproteobacteria bacterium]|nr:peptidase T [Alphaproteobacteria bacterium]